MAYQEIEFSSPEQKDKRAVTKQVFIIDAPQKRVANVSLSDVEIEIIGRTHQKLGFGNHKGNRFTIIVRGCCNEDGSPMSESEAIARIQQIENKMKDELGDGIFLIGLALKDLARGDL